MSNEVETPKFLKNLMNHVRKNMGVYWALAGGAEVFCDVGDDPEKKTIAQYLNEQRQMKNYQTEEVISVEVTAMQERREAETLDLSEVYKIKAFQEMATENVDNLVVAHKADVSSHDEKPSAARQAQLDQAVQGMKAVKAGSDAVEDVADIAGASIVQMNPEKYTEKAASSAHRA